MNGYSVKQVSEMAKVSIRTLHHYDKIGLLKPGTRTRAGYRLYDTNDLLRLQQILFFRELEFALEEIRQILDDPEFDMLHALEFHREQLEKRSERLHTLLITIDKTIANLKDVKPMIRPEEMYEGFSKEQIAAYEKEAKEKYGTEAVEASYQRLSQMSPEALNKLKQDQKEFPLLLLKVMDKDPGDPEVQQLIAHHHSIIEKFYPCPPDKYRCLGLMYVEDERFRINYDQHKAGMAEFLNKAINYYCDHYTK